MSKQPHTLSRSRFEVSADIGSVSALLCRPAKVRASLVLAHGAGAGMEHATMGAIAETLAAKGIATLRFNFPFKENGLPRTDSRPVATRVIARAAALARELLPGVPLLLGGHSFGGRMASHAVLDQAIEDVAGLVFCAFPLHPADKPGTSRAEHLPKIRVPMLFLSGTRDALATPTLLDETVASLGKRATLVWLETADHSYKVLKRQRKSTLGIFDEMAEATSRFVDELPG